jgi:murein DD-endopeptidase MepM/ murein hydrolase activator NlpD
LAGKILNSSGSYRRGGAPEWQGVRLAANSCDNVRAVSTGQVVFADWFRNLGLLMIIDHGNGYMTLYGHNDDLLKKRGDWVEDGEVIAHAGDSGGQGQAKRSFGCHQECRDDSSNGRGLRHNDIFADEGKYGETGEQRRRDPSHQSEQIAPSGRQEHNGCGPAEVGDRRHQDEEREITHRHFREGRPTLRRRSGRAP